MRKPTPLRVFLSYAYDHDHQDEMVTIADRVRAAGAQRIFDQDVGSPERPPPEGWNAWARNALRQADVIAMCWCETYLKRHLREEEHGRGWGSSYEIAWLAEDLRRSDRRTNRLLAVVRSHADPTVVSSDFCSAEAGIGVVHHHPAERFSAVGLPLLAWDRTVGRALRTALKRALPDGLRFPLLRHPTSTYTDPIDQTVEAMVRLHAEDALRQLHQPELRPLLRAWSLLQAVIDAGPLPGGLDLRPILTPFLYGDADLQRPLIHPVGPLARVLLGSRTTAELLQLGRALRSALPSSHDHAPLEAWLGAPLPRPKVISTRVDWAEGRFHVHDIRLLDGYSPPQSPDLGDDLDDDLAFVLHKALKVVDPKDLWLRLEAHPRDALAHPVSELSHPDPTLGTFGDIFNVVTLWPTRPYANDHVQPPRHISGGGVCAPEQVFPPGESGTELSARPPDPNDQAVLVRLAAESSWAPLPHEDEPHVSRAHKTGAWLTVLSPLSADQLADRLFPAEGGTRSPCSPDTLLGRVRSTLRRGEPTHILWTDLDYPTSSFARSPLRSAP